MHKNSSIVVNFIGTLQERNVRLLISSIVSKQDVVKEEQIKEVLISLKALVYNNEIKYLKILVNEIDKLIKEFNIPIGIIDYNAELFRALKQVIKKTKVKLYKNKNVADLFIDPQKYKEDLCVLIYDEDEVNTENISSSLSKYGYTIIKAKDAKEFQEYMHDKSYDIIVSHSVINANILNNTSKKAPLSLSRKLISNLPVFMDTAVETLVSFTGLEAKKQAHSIKGFDTSLDEDNICAVMHFNGDIEGYFTLVFPKDIAIIALESLLGETVEASDVDTLKDGVGEFCNIITGSTKTAFDKNDIKIIFDLPKTYSSLKETQEYIGQNNGVWIDMELAGKSFYMFITK